MSSWTTIHNLRPRWCLWNLLRNTSTVFILIFLKTLIKYLITGAQSYLSFCFGLCFIHGVWRGGVTWWRPRFRNLIWKIVFWKNHRAKTLHSFLGGGFSSFKTSPSPCLTTEVCLAGLSILCPVDTCWAAGLWPELYPLPLPPPPHLSMGRRVGYATSHMAMDSWPETNIFSYISIKENEAGWDGFFCVVPLYFRNFKVCTITYRNTRWVPMPAQPPSVMGCARVSQRPYALEYPSTVPASGGHRASATLAHHSGGYVV